jgi:hypothetical protein
VSELEELRQIVETLTAVVHAQAKHLERAVERIEQATGPLGLAPDFAVGAAETAALLVQLKKRARANVA